MQSEITIKNLKKYFAEIKAVDDISFTVQKGELFGFLGVNGAGKSTTIRMMCTLFSPTDGEIWIGGQQVGVHDEEIRQKIGVVWQENVLDDRLTVKENFAGTRSNVSDKACMAKGTHSDSLRKASFGGYLHEALCKTFRWTKKAM